MPSPARSYPWRRKRRKSKPRRKTSQPRRPGQHVCPPDPALKSARLHATRDASILTLLTLQRFNDCWFMRVLVVEDEKKTASFVRKALQAEGFAVDICHNGDEALSAAVAAPYDALVLDIMLPGRDGLSVLRLLRERKNATPVLLLSAR